MPYSDYERAYNMFKPRPATVVESQVGAVRVTDHTRAISPSRWIPSVEESAAIGTTGVVIQTSDTDVLFIPDGVPWTSARNVRQLRDQVADTVASVNAIPETVDVAVSSAIADADYAPYVEPYVISALAADDAPAQAAALAADAAVTEAFTTRPILEGGSIVEPDIVWSVTDSEGRRGPFEIDSAGGITKHSAGKIREAMGEGALLTEMPITSGYTFAITDQADRIAFGVRTDGSTTVTDATTTRLPIVGWGTSMMNGSTGAGTTLLTVIRDELGLTPGDVVNYGVSGMRSPGIAAQQGGNPAILTVAGDTIPASGGVTVTVDPALRADTFYAWVYGGAIPGVLMGVPGTLSYPDVDPAASASEATFTRTTAGTAVPMPGPRPFLPDRRSARDNMTIFWAGHNDQANLAQVQGNYRKMVASLTHEQYLILGETHAYVAGDDDALNTWLASEFPYNFVDLKAFMASTRSLDAVGLIPTADDLADIAAGLVPRTLRPNGDVVHFNATGYQAAGKYVAQILTEKGWL